MTLDDPPKKFSPLFKVVFLIFGSITAFIAFQTMKLWEIRHSWPTVTGVVIKTAPKGWWDEEKQWRYYLAYQYQVGDNTYTGTRFHLKERSIKKFTYLIRGFKKGDPIMVWYHPENPEQAVINAEYLRDAMALMLVFTGFLFLAGSMIFKENRWQHQVLALTVAISDNYKGKEPLPTSTILDDSNRILSLNTGMSVYWYRGIPFLFFSFLTLFFMILFLNEINPGWTLSDYLGVMAASWGLSFIAGFFVKKAFKKTLIIDSPAKKIKEISNTFFKQSLSVYNFSDIRELKLHRDQWHVTNTLKNWILYMHTQMQQSIFISFRHRDIQPAHKTYLEIIKTRIEFLIFGDPHAKTK